MRFFAEKTAKYRCFLHRNILFPQCNHLNTLALKVHNLKFAIVSTLTDVKQMFSFCFLWCFWNFARIDYQYFTISKQILKKKIMM